MAMDKDLMSNLDTALKHNLSLDEEDALLRDEVNQTDIDTISIKDQTDSQMETRLERAPRPLCSGPSMNKKRGKRGKRGGFNQRDGGNQKDKIAPTQFNQSKVTTTDLLGEANNNGGMVNHSCTASNVGTGSNGPQKITTNPQSATPSSKDGFQSTKRQRSGKNSPETEQPNKQRKFADVVADDLKLMIIDSDKAMSIEQAGQLEITLHGLMDEYIAQKPRLCPTFHDLKYTGENLRLICADSFSKQWIETMLSKMEPPWEDAQLRIVPIPPKVRRPTIRFFIPNGMKKQEFSEVLMKFRSQNPPLQTSSWAAWKQDEREVGIFYHVSVDPETIALIESKANKLFYYFSKIKIIMPPKPPSAETAEALGVKDVKE